MYWGEPNESSDDSARAVIQIKSDPKLPAAENNESEKCMTPFKCCKLQP